MLLHVPLTRGGDHQTFHCIGKSFLQRQKPGCVLLNASRGAVIDSQSLILFGTHLVWCLDVFEHEPRIDKAILNRALIATPHIAGYSLQSKVRGVEMIFQYAVQHGLIVSSLAPSIEMPHQQLTFADSLHHWQDIVLGVFNPLVMTAMMRQVLLATEDDGSAFDQMRHQFNYRHEFAYTSINGVDVSDQDAALLVRLGMRFLANG